MFKHILQATAAAAAMFNIELEPQEKVVHE